MFLVGIMSWWYGNGLRLRLAMIGDRIDRTNDYFSIGLLITTLFAPYRQISAGKVSGSLSAQMHAFGDRLISRCIGAIVRTFMIVFGLFVIILQSISGLVVVLFWLIIPLFPVVGLLVTVIGWVPSWL
jgi:hypothetical protein